MGGKERYRIKFSRQNEVLPDGKKFLSEWDLQTDPFTMLAQYFEKQGEMTFRPDPEEGENAITIFATDEAAEQFSKAKNTPEYKALRTACSPNPFFEDTPLLDACQWNDELKSRLTALYWQRRADYLQSVHDRPFNPGNPISRELKHDEIVLSVNIHNAKINAKKALGDLLPLTVDSPEYRSLIEQTVQ